MDNRASSKDVPSHYKVLGITPLEVADLWIPKEVSPVYAALYSDVLKYLGRHPYKGDAVKDLEKLIDCANRLKERLESGKETINGNFLENRTRICKKCEEDSKRPACDPDNQEYVDNWV